MKILGYASATFESILGEGKIAYIYRYKIIRLKIVIYKLGFRLSNGEYYEIMLTVSIGNE